MITIFCMILGVYFVFYGIFLLFGLFTPTRSRLLIEEDKIKLWQKKEGFTKILWGVDAALFGMYYSKAFAPMLFLAGFVVLTIITISLTYKNNRKYME